VSHGIWMAHHTCVQRPPGCAWWYRWSVSAGDEDLEPPGGSAKVTDRVARRRFAEVVARKYGVDAGDVEHVLSNLTLPPIERLRRSMRRARLGRLAHR
jgi:hypothetical protein